MSTKTESLSKKRLFRRFTALMMMFVLLFSMATNSFAALATGIPVPSGTLAPSVPDIFIPPVVVPPIVPPVVVPPVVPPVVVPVVDVPPVVIPPVITPPVTSIDRYTFCSTENDWCSFSGTGTVAFGADGSFFYQTATDGIYCSNDVFGDPAYGIGKSCYYKLSDATIVAQAMNANQIGYASGDSASSVTANLTLASTVGFATVIWQSSNPTVVDANGFVTRPVYGSGDASVTLMATVVYGTVSDVQTFNVIVKEAPQTEASIIAQAQSDLAISYAEGDSAASVKQNVFLGTTGYMGSDIKWNSSNPSLVSYSGVVTRPSVGSDQSVDLTATIWYGDSMVTKIFTVIVKTTYVAPTVVQLTPSTSQLTLTAGSSSAPVGLTAYYSDETSADVTQDASWISSNTDIASVSNGVITPVSAGATVISATYMDVTTVVNVVVAPRVVIPPTCGELPVGLPTNVLIGFPFRSLVAVAPVPPVCAPPVVTPTVTSLVYSPSSVNLFVGGTQSTVVTATYSDNTTADVTALSTWTAVDPTVASVTYGVVKGLSAGTTSITITLNGVTVSIPVVVSAVPVITPPVIIPPVIIPPVVTPPVEPPVIVPPVVAPTITSLVYSPNSLTMLVGETKSTVLTATYSDSTRANVTGLATWVSLNPTIATVTSGSVKGVSAGTTVITATYGGVSVSIPVAINAVVITPPVPVSTGGGGGGGSTSTPAPVIDPTPTPVVTPDKPSFNNKVSTDVVKGLVAKAQTATAKSFSDVPNTSWSAKAIDLASRIGIINGYTDGSFKPTGSITRGEFATMLANTLGVMPVGNDNFDDVKGHWAADAIKALKVNGIISGYGDGSFKPDQLITRAEIVAMLSAVQRPGFIQPTIHFSDVKGNWAEDVINQFAQLGIVSGTGDGKFDPNTNASREQSVAMLLRMLNLNLDLGWNLK